MPNSIELDNISNSIKEIVEDMGFRFYDISYNEVSKILKIYIDKVQGGITIGDCKNVSRAVSDYLDSLDRISFSYTLEVSSPGIERSLRRPEHFTWAVGKLVEINTSKKKITGYLRNIQNDGIIIGGASGEDFVPYASIVRAKVLEEKLYGKRR